MARDVIPRPGRSGQDAQGAELGGVEGGGPLPAGGGEGAVGGCVEEAAGGGERDGDVLLGDQGSVDDGQPRAVPLRPDPPDDDLGVG